MTNPNSPESTNKPVTAWYDRTGDNHPAQLEPCTECGAHPGAPCMSTVGLCGHGATGTLIRGLHAARVDAARVRASAESASEDAGHYAIRDVFDGRLCLGVLA